MTADLPVAEVIAERRYGGLRTARVMCVYCGHTHLHPWPTGDNTHPYTAHCGQGSYTIATTTGRKTTP